MFPFSILDLTHTINPSIPHWPGSKQFTNTVKHSYKDVGCHVTEYSMTAGLGTHVDAPAHFIEGGKHIAQLNIADLIAPAVMLDVSSAVAGDADYTVQPSDIDAYEKSFGPIKRGSLVLICTGWSERWPDSISYRNADVQGKNHFPGVSLEAAQMLSERAIGGIGIDTFSLDAGLATTFPVHNFLLAKGLYFIENLTNLNKIPPTGAYVGVFPLLVDEGSEAPARVVAFLPRN